MFDEARSTHDFIDGCESSADAALNANVRKAAGFQGLHELALLKELQSEPRTLSSVPATKKNPRQVGGPSNQSAVTRQSQLLGAHAQAELQRLKSLPPTSHKWTWGVDITETDVLAINQETKGKGKAHHSGYAGSLPDGVYQKEWSVTPSLPTAVSAAYSRPPTVTGIDAGLYFSDTGSNDSPHSDAVSDADAAPDGNPVPDADAVPDAAADAVVHMVWQGEDDAAHDANRATGFDAADIYLANSTSSSPPANPLSSAFATASDAADVFLSSSGTDSASSDGESDPDASSLGNLISTAVPTASDAADVFLSSSGTDSASSDGESDPDASSLGNLISTAVPTASDAANVFLSSSETDSTGSHADADADTDADTDTDSDSEDNFGAESPSTSQIENPTPSRITLPIYSHADFSYIDETWLPGSDDMDTMDDE
jgi:hypothetical protein